MKNIFLLILILTSSFVYADDNLFQKLNPEKTGEVESDCITVFEEGTNSKTAFRVLFPVKPEQLWPVLIDTNGWKKVHSGDYADSLTLDGNQFNLVSTKKPSDLKAFYELIGGQTFPSEYGRVKGGQWMSYAFQRLSLPWPLKDRWTVLKIKNDETKASDGRYRYDYKMGGGNFKYLKGYWEIFPVKGRPGWSEFRGLYETDPGIDVPHFLAKTLFKASVKRNAKENLDVIQQQEKL